MKEFTLHIPDWKLITKDTANFYFTESEKRLKETIETSKNITKSTERIITFLIPSFVVIFGYLTNLFSTEDVFTGVQFSITLVCIIFCLVASYSLFRCSCILIPRKIMTTGVMPRDIISNKQIKKQGLTDIQHLDLVLTACEWFQIKIDLNISSNERRADTLKHLHDIIMVFTPLVCLIVFCLSLFISGYFS